MGVESSPTKPADSPLFFGDPKWTDYDFSVWAMRTQGNDQFALWFRRADGSDMHILAP